MKKGGKASKRLRKTIFGLLETEVIKKNPKRIVWTRLLEAIIDRINLNAPIRIMLDDNILSLTAGQRIIKQLVQIVVLTILGFDSSSKLFTRLQHLKYKIAHVRIVRNDVFTLRLDTK